MPTPIAIKIQIDELVYYAIDTSLSDDHNFPYLDNKNRHSTRIMFPGSETLADVLNNDSYTEIYRNLVEARAYNLKLLDGALVQMQYDFWRGNLMRHRLAFFPSPLLGEFQNDPEIYMNDDLYADVVDSNIVHTPLRFDYDGEIGSAHGVAHPKSHLTIGQYKNCRIPVSAPLTPVQFADFIVRNFYNTMYEQYADKLPRSNARFKASIASHEKKMAHLVV